MMGQSAKKGMSGTVKGIIILASIISGIVLVILCWSSIKSIFKDQEIAEKCGKKSYEEWDLEPEGTDAQNRFIKICKDLIGKPEGYMDAECAAKTKAQWEALVPNWAWPADAAAKRLSCIAEYTKLEEEATVEENKITLDDITDKHVISDSFWI